MSQLWRAMERSELGAAPRGEGRRVFSICHVTDLHVMDSVSPMRFEWIETMAADPRWHPLLHMHRPQEALVPWAVAAHLAAIRTGPPVDLVLSTGDNFDNAQRNELDAYLTFFAGGECALSPAGGVHDADADHDTDAPWPFWSPSPGVTDRWKRRGYPAIPTWTEQTSVPITSPPIGVPWTSLPGNHDLMCQGTADVNRALAAIAVGDRKPIRPRRGFAPDDAGELFVEWPELFLGEGDRQIPADPSRRPIDLAEWVTAHAAAGALGWSRLNTSTRRADAVVDLEEVRLVMLDTNHPHADYQGSIGRAQLDWLDAQLAEVDRDGRLAVIASHHGPSTLVNERGADPDRLLSDPFLEVLHRHPSAVVWLNGHRHINRITPRPGPNGGLWEITTASLIDWPCERRTVELTRHAGGGVTIETSLHGNDAWGRNDPAGWHLDLAHRFAGPGDGSHSRGSMEGQPEDREVRLFIAR